jgi:DNA-binding MarR family transcriptional regulator
MSSISAEAELARRCLIIPQSVTGLMAGLQQEQLIERSASASHGRIMEIAPSASAREQLKAAHRIMSAVEDKMLARPTSSQRRELAGPLRLRIDGIGS